MGGFPLVNAQRPILTGGPIYHRFVVAYVLLALGCTLGLYKTWNIGRAAERDRRAIQVLAREGAQAKSGVCALERDLERRVRGEIVFLRDHPNGLPGIATAAQIRTNIANQRRTIKALRDARCG